MTVQPLAGIIAGRIMKSGDLWVARTSCLGLEPNPIGSGIWFVWFWSTKICPETTKWNGPGSDDLLQLYRAGMHLQWPDEIRTKNGWQATKRGGCDHKMWKHRCVHVLYVHLNMKNCHWSVVKLGLKSTEDGIRFPGCGDGKVCLKLHMGLLAKWEAK